MTQIGCLAEPIGCLAEVALKPERSLSVQIAEVIGRLGVSSLSRHFIPLGSLGSIRQLPGERASESPSKTVRHTGPGVVKRTQAELGLGVPFFRGAQIEPIRPGVVLLQRGGTHLEHVAQFVNRFHVTETRLLGQALHICALIGRHGVFRGCQKQVGLEACGLCEHAGLLGLVVAQVVHCLVLRVIGHEVEPLEGLKPRIRRDFIPREDALGQAQLGWGIVPS